MTVAEKHVGRVLVLDADTLPALAAVRSLGRGGVRVIAASHSDKPIAGRSRHAAGTLRYPSPLEDSEAFLTWMESQLASIPDLTMVLPVTERTLVPISSHFSDPARRRLFAVPEAPALEQVLDKSLTAELATRCQVPQPRSWIVHGEAELDAIMPELPFPLVVKPGRSISTGDRRLALTVRYTHSAGGLERLARELLPHTHLILQEYFRGDGVGVEVLARRGEIVYAFQHRRLHEVPLTGGGSSLRISEEVDPALLAASRDLLAALGWHGVAMVEFKQDAASGAFVLVEINGRLWGSLPLAVAAGADFPRLLYAQHRDLPLPDLPPYRRGLRCRKLASDLQWCEAVFRREADPRLVPIPGRGRAAREMLAMFLPGERFDAQSWADPLPGLVDLGRIGGRYWRRLRGLAAETAGRLRQRHRHRRAAVRRDARGARRILFVCYGNINRSAVAQVLAEQGLPAEAPVMFRSAGLHPEGDRAPDPRMAALAQARDIDMSGFRSRVLDPGLAAWADLILVMEVGQLAPVRALAAGRPVHLLGGFDRGGILAAEIPDPYNGPPELYRRVFEQVARCVVRLRGAIDSGEERGG